MNIVQVDNNAFELVTKTTPNKRKRDNTGGVVLPANLCHGGIVGNNNKENHLIHHNFMEVKSIAEIFAQKKETPLADNAYEVSRKPPKKKSKHDIWQATNSEYLYFDRWSEVGCFVTELTDWFLFFFIEEPVEDGCFDNAALNLNVPEKIVNPFEVKRDVVPVNDDHCFVNSGLNLRGAEREVRNPYEIVRDPMTVVPNKEVQGEW